MKLLKRSYNYLNYILKFFLNKGYRKYNIGINQNLIFNSLKTTQSPDIEYKIHGKVFYFINEKKTFLTDAESDKTLLNSIPSRFVKYKSISNFDIKYIWDLSRFQFLDEYFAKTGNNNTSKSFFLDLIKTFSASNKPYFGPNWLCTMDVAIRGVNIAYYYDLLCVENKFTQKENEFITDILANHLFYIEKNLEWVPTKRGNHYLSNICGLLILSCKFPLNEDTQRVLKFAFNEFLAELRLQFHSEGSYYENSTAYHRLALEMIFYTSAYLNTLNNQTKEFLFENIANSHTFNNFEEVLSKKLYPLLDRATTFCTDITIPDGSFHQIGDNDSGRFINRDSYWLNEYEKKYNNSFISRSCFTIVNDVIEYFKIVNFERSDSLSNVDFNPISTSTFLINYDAFHFPANVPLSKLEQKYYSQFGLVIWSSDTIYIAFRCGINDGKYVHAHEDQLSVELIIGNNNLIRDKGSFCYTRDVIKRELYRSQDSHFVPLFSDKTQGTKTSLFNFKYNGSFVISNINTNKVEGIWEIEDRIIKRSLEIKENGIYITDDVTENFINLAQKREIDELTKVSFSPEYGLN